MSAIASNENGDQAAAVAATAPPTFEMDAEGNGITIAGWKIQAVQKAITKTIDEERLTKSLQMKLPAMTFHSSHLTLQTGEHPHPVFELTFNAFDALSQVSKQTDPSIKVRAAAQWKSKEKRTDVQITPLQKATDWTFTTKYTGTTTTTTTTIAAAAATDGCSSKETHSADNSPKHTLNYNLLKDTTLPILYSKQIVLFEDELDDNGVASYKVRIRVMPTFFFILARYFLRVDGVIVRLYDTRYFHEYATDYIVRETVHREANLNTLPNLHASVLRDAALLEPQLPKTYSTLDNIYKT